MNDSAGSEGSVVGTIGIVGPAVTIVSEPSQLKAFAHPTRICLLELLIKQAMTTKQLGDFLGMSAARAHYHVKFLERAGLVTQVYQREKAGVIEKYYKAVSRKYIVARTIGGFAEPGAVILESLSGALLSGAVAADSGRGDDVGLVYGASERITLTSGQLESLLQVATTLQTVQEEFGRLGARAEVSAAAAAEIGSAVAGDAGGDAPPMELVYELTLALYAGGPELGSGTQVESAQDVGEEYKEDEDG